MAKRKLNYIEQDAIKARHIYCYTQNNHGRFVRWAKRSVHRRERREGQREAREG
jgi:hypothetical protein